MSSSSVASFWDEKYEIATPETGVFQTIDTLYAQYDYWCRTSGRKPVSKQNFGQELTNITGQESVRAYVNSKRVRGRYVLESDGAPPLPDPTDTLLPPIIIK